MIVRSFAALLLFCVTVLTPMSLSARAAEPNVVASHYDVTVDLRPDGSLDVVERITLRVGSKAITWFERRVPGRYTDGLTDVAAFIDGRPVDSLPNGLGVRLRQRSGSLGGTDIDARFQFEPTANRERTFELRYRAAHVLTREAAGPRLVWHALPTSHAYPIDNAEVTLRAPQGTLAVAMDMRGGDMRPATSWQDGLVVARGGLRANDGITLDVTFSADTIHPVEPAWVAVVENQQKLTPAFMTAGITLLVIGAGTLIMIRIRTSRSMNLAAETSYPANGTTFAPAIASALVKGGQTSGWLPVQAAFFRLVRDRAVVVEKIGTVFTVTLGAKSAAASHERWIIDAVAAAGGPIELRALTTTLMRGQRGFHAALRADMLAQGWLDTDRMSTSRGLTRAGVVLLLIALTSLAAMAIFLIGSLGPAVMAIPAAVFLDSVGFLVGGQVLSRLSDLGTHEAARWQARVIELRAVARGADGHTLGEFEQWFPLAIGAGFGGRWLKGFRPQLQSSGAELGWVKLMGSPEDLDVALDAVMAESGASHGDGAGSGGDGGGAGGGSSAAG